MATNQPYTIEEIQKRVNVLVNNDNATPTEGDDEWETRLLLIHQAIGKHETKDVRWREYWTEYTHGSTVAAGTTTYSLSALTDLKEMGGALVLTVNSVETKIQVVSPEQSQTYKNARVAWLTGNNYAGWTLNLGWTPATGDGTVGATISFPYYKYAFKPTANANKVEMSDPNFIVYDVAATKSLMESKNNLWSVYNTEALNCMDRMMAQNELNPPYQNNSIEDVDAINGAYIGE